MYHVRLAVYVRKENHHKPRDHTKGSCCAGARLGPEEHCEVGRALQIRQGIDVALLRARAHQENDREIEPLGWGRGVLALVYFVDIGTRNVHVREKVGQGEIAKVCVCVHAYNPNLMASPQRGDASCPRSRTDGSRAETGRPRGRARIQRHEGKHHYQRGVYAMRTTFACACACADAGAGKDRVEVSDAYGA